MSTKPTKRHGACAAAALVAAAWMGCSGSDDTGVNPAPTGGSGGSAGTGTVDAAAGTGGDTGTGGAAGTGGGTGGEAGTGGSPAKVRTVLERNVFLNLDEPDNLIIDGGFEFTGDSSFSWGSTTQWLLSLGNGAVCRSGLRCARIPQNDGIYGLFVTPESGAMDLTIHTASMLGTCPAYTAMVFDVYTQQNIKPLLRTSRVVGQDGWCEDKFRVTALPYSSPALYLESTNRDMVIDDVVMKVSPDRSLPAPPEEAVPQALRERVERAREKARSQLWQRRDQRLPLHRLAPWSARLPAWIR